MPTISLIYIYTIYLQQLYLKMKLSYNHLKMNMIVTMKIQWWKNLGPPKLQSGYVIGASSSQSSFFWWYPLLLLHWQLYWSHILQVCLNLAYCTSSCSKVLTLFLPAVVTWHSCMGWFRPWPIEVGLNHLSFFHTSYGNTGWGVFKSGVQSQKDLRINILKGNN